MTAQGIKSTFPVTTIRSYPTPDHRRVDLVSTGHFGRVTDLYGLLNNTQFEL